MKSCRNKFRSFSLFISSPSPVKLITHSFMIFLSGMIYIMAKLELWRLVQTLELAPQFFWLLVLTLFPHWCKISRPYLVPVPDYWTSIKTIPRTKIKSIQWTLSSSTPPNSNISLIWTNPLSPWKSLNKLS